MKKNYMFSKNKDEVYNAFLYEDGVRGDHYSDCNGIYRFSAMAHYKKLNKNNINEIVLNLAKKLYKLPMIPSRIFVFEGYNIEVEWAAKNLQVVNDKMHYLKLALEFANFLDEIGIDELKINSGTFDDDPEYFSDAMNRKFNTNPVFNRECFGHEKIEIMYFL